MSDARLRITRETFWIRTQAHSFSCRVRSSSRFVPQAGWVPGQSNNRRDRICSSVMSAAVFPSYCTLQSVLVVTCISVSVTWIWEQQWRVLSRNAFNIAIEDWRIHRRGQIAYYNHVSNSAVFFSMYHLPIHISMDARAYTRFPAVHSH
jgi:hypothetical protein